MEVSSAPNDAIAVEKVSSPKSISGESITVETERESPITQASSRGAANVEVITAGTIELQLPPGMSEHDFMPRHSSNAPKVPQRHLSCQLVGSAEAEAKKLEIRKALNNSFRRNTTGSAGPGAKGRRGTKSRYDAK